MCIQNIYMIKHFCNVYSVLKYRSFYRFYSRKMSKTKVLNIRIEPELKKKAKKLAEADGRSLSNWVTKLISTTVEAAEKKKEEKK